MKDLSILARAAMALSGAGRVAAVLLTVMLTMTAQTARAGGKVNLSDNGNGTFEVSLDQTTWSSSLENVTEGTQVWCRATPDNGYDLLGLNINGTSYSPLDVQGVVYASGIWTYSFEMPTGDVTINAHFGIQHYTPPASIYPGVSTSVTGGGTVQVSLDKTDETNWTTSLTDVAPGTKVWFRITPDNGYHLQNYNISNAGSNAVTTAGDTFTMPDADVTVSATFVYDGGIAQILTVTVENDGHGTASASDNRPAAGTTVTLTATPTDAGYFFYYWEDESNNITFANRYKATTSFIMPNGNVKVKAHFVDGIELNGNDDSGITNELRSSQGKRRNVRLTRTFPAGKKQTVCLPFDPTRLFDYGTVWEFTGIDGSGRAVMTERTSAPNLQDNTPYIFEANDDITGITFSNVLITIGADPKTVDATAGFTFHGTYEEKIWEATSDEVTQGKIYGFMMQDNDGQQVGQFVKARRRTHLRPFSCWLEYSGELTDTDPTSQARTRNGNELPDVIEIVWQSAEASGEATGIETVVTSPDPSCRRGSEWYSLDGRRLAGQPSAKGVYINNGKKIVIK